MMKKEMIIETTMVREKSLENQRKRFFLSEFLNNSIQDRKKQCFEKESSFMEACIYIKEEIEKNNEKDNEFLGLVENKRKALLGDEKTRNLYLDKINLIIKNKELTDIEYPMWYESLSDGIFCENWGFGGLSLWIKNTNNLYENSKGAKIIGDHIFFEIDNKTIIQSQKINRHKRDEIREILYEETSLVSKRGSNVTRKFKIENGIKLIIFEEEITENREDIFIFRRNEKALFSLEELANNRIIPKEKIEFFRNEIFNDANIILVDWTKEAGGDFVNCSNQEKEPCKLGLFISNRNEKTWGGLSDKSANFKINIKNLDDTSKTNIYKTFWEEEIGYFVFDGASSSVDFEFINYMVNRENINMQIIIYNSSPEGVMSQFENIDYRLEKGNYANIDTKKSRKFNYLLEFYDFKSKKLKTIYKLNYIDGKVELKSVCKFLEEIDDWHWEENLTIT